MWSCIFSLFIKKFTNSFSFPSRELSLAFDLLVNQQFARELLHSKNISQRQQQEQHFCCNVYTEKLTSRVVKSCHVFSLFRCTSLALSSPLAFSAFPLCGWTRGVAGRNVAQRGRDTVSVSAEWRRL